MRRIEETARARCVTAAGVCASFPLRFTPNRSGRPEDVQGDT
jgi:hypothetical protein